MDGETSPLLSGTPTPTLHDSDSDSYTSRDPRASFSWLIPVAVMATLCNALTTSSRHAFFREFVCEEMGGLPSTPDPSLLQIDGQLHFTAFSRLDCSSPPFLSGLVSINLASMIATCVLSALSTGWWSRFGDIYGRRYALMISVLGSILLNLIFTAVAGSPSLEGLAQPCIFIGLLLEGLLGGSATFHGAIHAYTADVSPAGSWSTIFSILQAIVLSCTVFGSWIGLGVDFVKPFLSFGLSAAIGFINLGFIFFFLPESLPEEFEFDEPMKVNFKDVKKSIYSTVTILTAGHRLAFFGLAFFLYSLRVTPGADLELELMVDLDLMKSSSVPHGRTSVPDVAGSVSLSSPLRSRHHTPIRRRSRLACDEVWAFAQQNKACRKTININIHPLQQTRSFECKLSPR